MKGSVDLGNGKAAVAVACRGFHGELGRECPGHCDRLGIGGNGVRFGGWRSKAGKPVGSVIGGVRSEQVQGAKAPVAVNERIAVAEVPLHVAHGA